MHSVANGKPCFFGMRCPIGVDATSGLVHSVASTAANAHELNTAADRLHGDERFIYGDAGGIGIVNLTISRTAKLGSELPSRPRPTPSASRDTREPLPAQANHWMVRERMPDPA